MSVLNQSPSPTQQYSRSKDQDAAKDREEPCAGAAGVWKGRAGSVTNDNGKISILKAKKIIRIVDQ